jgi:hypothetical protein
MAVPGEKRLLLADKLNAAEANWTFSDDKMDYVGSIKKTFWESLLDGVLSGIEQGAVIIMVKDFINKCFVSQGMVADFAIHRGDSKDMNHPEADHKDFPPHNPHTHIMLTTRHVDCEGFGKLKAREWESYGNSTLLISWRKEWEIVQNQMFERKGIDIRVSHEKRNRSHENERNDNRNISR